MVGRSVFLMLVADALGGGADLATDNPRGDPPAVAGHHHRQHLARVEPGRFGDTPDPEYRRQRAAVTACDYGMLIHVSTFPKAEECLGLGRMAVATKASEP